MKRILSLLTFIFAIAALSPIFAQQTPAADKAEDKIDRTENKRDRAENKRDRKENHRDRAENKKDRKEDVHDKREDNRDAREDVRDAKHEGGARDKREDAEAGTRGNGLAYCRTQHAGALLRKR